jgi:hypothetical protein
MLQSFVRCTFLQQRFGNPNERTKVKSNRRLTQTHRSFGRFQTALLLISRFISIMSWITSIILNFPNFIHDSVWIIIKKSISSYNYFRWIELFQLQLRVQGVVQLKYKDERKEMFDEFRRLPPIEGIKRLLLGRFVRMTLLFKCSHISLQTIPFYAIAKN